MKFEYLFWRKGQVRDWSLWVLHARAPWKVTTSSIGHFIFFFQYALYSIDCNGSHTNDSSRHIFLEPFVPVDFPFITFLRSCQLLLGWLDIVSCIIADTQSFGVTNKRGVATRSESTLQYLLAYVSKNVCHFISLVVFFCRYLWQYSDVKLWDSWNLDSFSPNESNVKILLLCVTWGFTFDRP